jgi:hypothetical protein
MIAAALIFAVGCVLDLYFLFDYVRRDFTLDTQSHSAIYGLFLIIVAAQLFGFTLLLELARRTGFAAHRDH